MYYKKFRKYLNEFLTGDEVPFEAFAKMVVKYKDDRNRVLSDVLPDVPQCISRENMMFVQMLRLF